jgi:hypothetical protein
MKITVEGYNEKVTIDVLDDLDVHEMLDVMLRLMAIMTYSKQNIENAVVEKSYEFNVNKIDFEE